MGVFHKTIKDVIALIEAGKYQEAAVVVDVHLNNDVGILSPLSATGNDIKLYHFTLKELLGLLRSPGDPRRMATKAAAAEQLVVQIKNNISEVVKLGHIVIE